MNRRLSKLEMFCGFGRAIASLSTCRRDKVGAIVFPTDCSSIWALGYNGPARGLPNDSCTGQQARCGCAHAEANAVAKLPSGPDQGIMFSTRSPCMHCFNMIANCGRIQTFIWEEVYRETCWLEHLKTVGILVIKYSELNHAEI